MAVQKYPKQCEFHLVSSISVHKCLRQNTSKKTVHRFMVFKYLLNQTLFSFNDTTACNESDLFIISTKNVDPNKALKSFCLLNFPPIYG